MLQEYVFRFLSVRPGNQRKKIERTPKTVPVYEATRPTALSDNLKRLHDAGASAAEIMRAVRAYQNSPAHVKTLDGVPLEINKALHWLAAHSGTPVRDLNLGGAVESLFGRPVKELVGTEAFKTTSERLSDTLVAEAFHPTWDRPTDGLASARKWLALIEWLAQDKSLDPDAPLGLAFAELTLAIPDFARLPTPPPPGTQPPPTPQPRPEDQERERLRKYLQDLEGAHRELSRKAIDDDALLNPQVRVDLPPKLAEFEHRLSMIEARRDVMLCPDDGPNAIRKAPLTGGALPLASGGARVTFKPDTIAALSDVSKRVLADAKIDAAKVEPTLVVEMLEEQMRVTSAQLASNESADTVLLLGGVMMDTRKIRNSFLGARDLGDLLKDQCHFQAGVGDLLMVKQTLKAYELAEFAHVENVLAGEARVREHRRLNVREEIQVDEEERETEKERNLQSTERNEMQSEAEKTVKSQFELDAGLQVSGSYGPTVSFSASLNVGFSTSTEETQRKAVSYSREVTEKTSERVRERVKRELRRRMLEQVEELNRHSITNEPATNGHIRGIYRWLNKVYDAQILNYGQRMMFEFVVPEPAAYLIYALIENPPKDTELIKPVPPTLYGAPLKPSHLTRTNYLDFVAKYQVRNVPPPAGIPTRGGVRQAGQGTGRLGLWSRHKGRHPGRLLRIRRDRDGRLHLH